jgi:hypothetical protein
MLEFQAQLHNKPSWSKLFATIESKLLHSPIQVEPGQVQNF